MKAANLAAAILADRDRPTTSHNIVPCFVCGQTFVYRGRRGELNGRFCSTRCQDWFDAGNSPVSTEIPTTLRGWRVIAGPPGIEIGGDYHAGVFGRQPISSRQPISMRKGSKGFYIDCAHCQKEFESLGLRCCSVECERGHREREENLAVMAEVGIEPAAKRRCEALRCNNTIPKWRNGRQVSKSARFCSRKCQQRAGKRAAA